MRLLLTKMFKPEMVVALRVAKVVRPVTLRVLLTVVDPASVVVESTLSPPLEYSEVPEMVAAVRLLNVVRPVTLRVLLTVVDPNSVVAVSTLSPPEE